MEGRSEKEECRRNQGDGKQISVVGNQVSSVLRLPIPDLRFLAYGSSSTFQYASLMNFVQLAIGMLLMA